MSAFILVNLLVLLCVCHYKIVESSSCSVIDTGITDLSSLADYCMRNAAKQGRSVVHVLTNRKCIICGNLRSSGENCVGYRRQPTTQVRLLLLRMDVEKCSSVTPFSLLFSNKAKISQIFDDAGIIMTWSYKSPLVDNDHKGFFLKVQTELLLKNGSLAVRLGFNWTSSIKVDRFKKENLVSAYPWSTETLKSDGKWFDWHIDGGSYIRAFYIGEIGGPCSVQRGYLCISSKRLSNWEMLSGHQCSYVWSSNGGPWSSNVKQAQIFQIFGKLNVAQMYIAE